MGSIDAVVAAAAAFVGSHLVLSHLLRRRLVDAIGEAPFQGVYSVVALLTFAWLVVAYRKAPLTAPLWPVGDGLWAVVTVVMLIASILLMGSFIRNPAFPTGGRPGSFPDAARGVYSRPLLEPIDQVRQCPRGGQSRTGRGGQHVERAGAAAPEIPARTRPSAAARICG